MIMIMTMMLPEDLVFQILLWLQVSSLLRFKLVCKSWFSIIESSNFIDQQLHHHHLHLDEQNLLVVSHNRKIPSVDISFISPSGSGSGNIFQVWENLDIPPSPLFHNPLDYGLSVIASCNGLICAETSCFTHILVFNPATKQLKYLPELPFPDYDLSRSSRPIIVGFGFDFKTNDYKVVRALQQQEYNESICNVIQTVVEVYNFSTNSWRTVVDAVIPVFLYHHNHGHCCINTPFQNGGIFCWLGYLHTPEEIGTILLFDFSKEIFETMLLPDRYRVPSKFTLTLALLKENIACIEWKDLDPWGKYISYIWVLNEFGVKDSWTKLYTVQLEPYTKPIGVFMNGELICEEQDHLGQKSKLSLCNPVSQEFRSLPFEGPIWFNVAVYKESLVNINKCIL
ncbi:hypothetical protein AQUCO_03300136v1 [Aquilegia coerulea]|uniref:F-box domain-containing protein n=1 Tax=Aquilegia coerulea TaxID=218851 RepID=A0A2G5CZN5_AQUCA|nr:hypothetical protein AQUCO_03300136v1 [Aquilegia coerulea]PIA36718.1 hypothetical protein AQUCO_03300136v1 [Aquilegia coerulea]